MIERPVYGDEEDEAAAAATVAAAAAAASNNVPPKTFTQEDVNRMLAEDRRKHKAQVDKHVLELENLKKSKTLTDKEKETLTSRIDELQNSLLTKEQLSVKEQEKLKKQSEEIAQKLTSERDLWSKRYHDSTIKQAITSEAAKAEAFDPDSLIAMLGPHTRLAEVNDAEGNATGEFEPKVKFADVDKQNKPVMLDLTVPETVKRMKETPKYGYLFKSTATGGLGTGSGAGNRSDADVTKMSVEQYREHRKKIGLAPKS
jgi:hypothetical protein